MLYYAIAGLVVISVSLIIYALLPNRSQDEKAIIRRRMAEGKSPREATEELRKQARDSVAKKMVKRVAPIAMRPVMPKNAEEMSKLRIKLSNAGFRRDNAPTLFLASKTIFAAGAALIALVYGFSQGYEIQKLFGVFVFSAGLGFMAPNFWLGSAAAKRIEKIRDGLPDSLDLLVITVESGLGLDAALQRVGDELKNVHPVISEDFQIATLETQMGIPRSEALQNLAVRAGAPEMRSLISIINQAERFGTSVSQALRRQADALRVKRRQAAEERAQKTAVKLMLPLIFFIFPAIFIVLGAPAALRLMDAFAD
ncbi:MAG: type II secretion system F family protein [Phycisphaerae bacterium]|nr:type II secretion system F family protein [Phycisphaerae bacterium]